MMHQINGAIEVLISEEWYDVVNVSNFLFAHGDLNGCLFGVDNYAGYLPLFPDRGLPTDCAEILRTRIEEFLDEDSHASWVLWAELKSVDWEESATTHDVRVSELAEAGGVETVVTKWLNEIDLQAVRDALDREPDATIKVGERKFKRLILKRKDALADTEFPLVMKLMACLAERFGDVSVRLTVWFG